jgi:serine protease
VTVPAAGSGEYYILVKGISGGSNYLLTVGNIGISSQLQESLIYDDFVPGELIVRFKSGKEQTARAALQSHGLSIQSIPQGKLHRIRYRGQQQRNLVFQNLGIDSVHTQKGLTSDPRHSKSAEAIEKRDTILLLHSLRDRDDIESVDVNYYRHPTAIPNDPLIADMWHLTTINLPTVWANSGYTGSGVTVAVIDTGILSGHPDMTGQISSDGYDFISDVNNAMDGDGLDPNPEDLGDGTDSPAPSSFHGTHVSGTIAARANNNPTPVGIAGIAYNAQIMPLRVLGKYGGTDADIIQAVYYAAGLDNASGVTPGIKADIINMSLGGPGYSSSFQAAVSAARTAGVIIVAAAGNESTSSKTYPAALNGVIAVSAVDQNKDLAWYSNYGQVADNWIDIAAPGGDTRVDLDGDGNPDGVLSTLGDDSGSTTVMTYDYYQGTSMAAPHVVGIIALMKEANPAMTPADLDTWLSSITDDLGSAGKDIYFGHGLINAAKAINVADGTTTFPATIAISNSNITFTPGMTGSSIIISNSGTSDFTAPVTFNITQNGAETWLSVSEDSVDANKLGSYLLSVDRSGLADGDYSATVTFSSLTAGVSDVVLTINLKVGFVGNEDVGYLYMVLVDANSGINRGYREMVPSGGVYLFSFAGIPAGNYLLFAGTDMDNDIYFCNAGEACGTYSNVPLQVNSNRTGIDFTVGFNSYGSAGVGATSQQSHGYSKVPTP